MLVPPAEIAVTITPSDTVDLATPVRGLWIGATPGVVTIVCQKGGAGVAIPVAAHSLLPVRVYRVNSTGTTAATITGLI